MSSHQQQTPGGTSTTSTVLPAAEVFEDMDSMRGPATRRLHQTGEREQVSAAWWFIKSTNPLFACMLHTLTGLECYEGLGAVQLWMTAILLSTGVPPGDSKPVRTLLC